MRSDVTNFNNLFEGRKQYVVPLFQRNYTWGPSNWKQLWEDVMSLLEADEEQKQHFLGPLITLPYQADPGGLSKFMLIDGQQRLTTLCVLLNSIRNYVRHRAPDLDEELYEEFVVNKRLKGNEHYKLLPGTYDQQAYFEVVSLELPKDRTSGVSQAFIWFSNKLEKANLNSDQIAKLKDAVLWRLTLISIVLDENDNPYEVFESINSKGLALTEAELIKNYLLMRIDPALHDTVFQQYWNPMEEALGDNLTEYIRHFEARRGSVVKVKEVYATVRQRIQKMQSKTAALDYLKELYHLHNFYCRFLSPDREPDRLARVYLNTFKQFDVTVIYPYLLNLYEYHDQDNLSEKELIESLEAVENWLIRTLLSNEQNKGQNKEAPVLHKNVLSKKTSLQTYPAALKNLLWSVKSYRYVSDDKLQNKLQTEPIFGGGKKAFLAKIVLNRIEDHLTSKEPGTSNYEVIRILPDKVEPGDDWCNYLSPSERDRVRDYADRIGNLALVNGPNCNEKHQYSHKRTLLMHSGIDLNLEFHEIEKWDLGVIEQRCQRIAEWVMAVWPQLGVGSGRGAYSDDDPTGKKPISFTLVGQEYELTEQTWVEFLVRVVEECIRFSFDPPKQVLERAGIKYSRVTVNFKRARELNGTGLCIDVNLTAQQILQKINRLLEAVGLDPEEDFSYRAVER